MAMKNLVFILILTLSLQAGAAQMAVDCFQRRPYMQLTMKWNDETGLRLSMASAEGIDGVPLYNGVVSTFSLALLEQQKKDLSAWPRVVELSWPAEKCKKHPTEPWVIECNGLAQVTKEYDGYAMPEWPFTTYMFAAYANKKIGVNGTNESREMSWAVEAEGTTYFLGFHFQSNLCQDRTK